MGDPAHPAHPLTIVLADDHAVMRGGLRMLLDAQPGFEVVASARSGPRSRQRLRFAAD